MPDKIEVFGKGTKIQHGKLNNRVYLIKIQKEDYPEVLDFISKIAEEHSYSKLFFKVPGWIVPALLKERFIIEAQIPAFYNKKADVFFMSKFLTQERLLNKEDDMLISLSKQLYEPDTSEMEIEVPDEFNLVAPDSKDAEKVADLYKQVFDSYPFPIFDPKYIKHTMENDVKYFGIETGGKLVALSSCEIDRKGQNAEMTDFATLPEFRGRKLSVLLLKQMEKIMKEDGISTLYTIARLNSPAMNKTFIRLNYKYSGTLINNTNISGKIESMSVYYKHV